MQREDRKMLQFLNTALKAIDDLVWGVPLIVLILAIGDLSDGTSEGDADPKTSRCSALHGSRMKKREAERLPALELFVLPCQQRSEREIL